MALNKSDIARVLEEIEPVLRSGWIQKVQQPADRAVVLDIRKPGRTYRLLISCQPDMSRLHLAEHIPPNPRIPLPFCQFLRAHFHGARIDDIRQVPGDRVVEITFTGKDGARTLVCDLTGKKANILVLDGDRQVLRDLLHQRELIGQPYCPRHTTGPSRSRDWEAARFTGAGSGEFPISAEIERHYQVRESVLKNDAEMDARLRVLKKALRKTRRRVEAWQADLAKAMTYRDYARFGELVKANLSLIQKGLDRVTVIDYFDDRLPEVTIPLDPTKSAQGNMNEYFRKHRKYLAADRELNPRIQRAEHDLDAIRQEISAIEQGSWIPPAVSPPFPNAIARPTRHKALDSGDRRQGPFRRFTSTDGLPILVGRNARENDELTFGLATSDDLWLHARGTPGSHVVVRVQKGAGPPPETLRDAAILALFYSDLKKAGKGEVIYTRRKWVKKAKGQAPGAVVVTREKSIMASLDHARLSALKNRAAH
jgi:predicted ribosome quality control (RQC) complex YloA/Tae2 family protein